MPGNWSDQEAKSWLATDDFGKTLDLPRQIAAAVIGQDNEVSNVMDVASGPGTFLAVFLDAFPNARGIWHDASQVMENQAKETLSRYADRLKWVKGDITDIGSSGIEPDLDVILTSRATHHLAVSELREFYAQAFGLLRPNGWLVNLDHVLLPGLWDERLRKTRKLFNAKSSSGEGGHKHERSAPTLSDHLGAMDGAGFDEQQVAWQAFYTVLILARKS